MEMAQPSTPCPNLPQCFYLSFLYLTWFLLTMFMWQPPYPLWPKQVSPPLKSLPFLRVQEIYHECQIYPDVSHPFLYILSMPVLCYYSKTEAFQSYFLSGPLRNSFADPCPRASQHPGSCNTLSMPSLFPAPPIVSILK